jgi:hypothetical protein
MVTACAEVGEELLKRAAATLASSLVSGSTNVLFLHGREEIRDELVSLLETNLVRLEKEASVEWLKASDSPQHAASQILDGVDAGQRLFLFVGQGIGDTTDEILNLLTGWADDELKLVV